MLSLLKLLLAVAAYVLNRFWLEYGVPGWFGRGYLNDLLLMPAALPLVLWIQRRLGWRTHDAVPTWTEVLGHVAVWSVICEIVGPRWLDRGTGDPGDVIAYAVGAVVAGLWWQHGGRMTAAAAAHEL